MFTYLPVDKLCSFAGIGTDTGIDTEDPEPSRRHIEQARERVKLFPDTRGFSSILIARRRADGKFETDLSPSEIECYKRLALENEDLKELPFYIVDITDEQMTLHAIGVRKGHCTPIAIKKTKELSQLDGPLQQEYMQRRLPEGKALCLSGLSQWPEFLSALYKKLREEGLSKFRNQQLKQIVRHFKSELLQKTESEVMEDLKKFSFTSWKATPNLKAETTNDVAARFTDNLKILSPEGALKLAGSLPILEEGEERDPDSFMKDWQAVRRRVSETSGKTVSGDDLRLWTLWMVTENGGRVSPRWSEELAREGVTTPEEVKHWLSKKLIEFSDVKAIFCRLMMEHFGVATPNENPFLKNSSKKSKLKAKRDSVFECRQRRVPKLLGHKAQDLGNGKAIVDFYECEGIPSRHEFRYALDKAVESLGKNPQQMPYQEIEVNGIDPSCFEELGLNKNGQWFPSEPIDVHLPEPSHAILKYCSRPSEQDYLPAKLNGKIFALKILESKEPIIVCQLPNYGSKDFSMDELHLHPSDVAKIDRIDQNYKQLAGKVIRYDDCVVLSA